MKKFFSGVDDCSREAVEVVSGTKSPGQALSSSPSSEVPRNKWSGAMARVPKAFRSRSKLALEPILEVRARPEADEPILAVRAEPEAEEPIRSAVEDKALTPNMPLYVQNGGLIPLSSRSTDVKRYTTLKFDGGERYEGEVVENVAKGYGVYQFAESGVCKSTYSGQWKAFKPHGFGVRVHANGTRYVGRFQCGVYDGMGVCTMENGMIAGQWENGFPHGCGMQEATEGGPSSYVGNYKYGLRCGPGVYTYSNGDEYSGMFADDVPHGLGVCRLEGGKASYLGRWNRGNRHGWSIFTLADGTIWSGKWVHGKLTWQLRVVSGDRDAYKEDEAEALSRSWDIARDARTASDAAVSTANSCCQPGGPHLVELEAARSRGEAMCKAAESAARKARAFKKVQWQPPRAADDSAEPVSHVQQVPPVKKGETPQADAGSEAPRTPDKELQAGLASKATPQASKPGGPMVSKHGVRSATEAAPPALPSASPRAAAEKGEAAAGTKVDTIKAAVSPGKKEQPPAAGKKVASEHVKMEAVRKARIMKRAQWHQLVQEEPDAGTESDQGLAPATPSKSEGTCSEEDEEARKQRELFLQKALRCALTPSPKIQMVVASRSH